MTRVLKKIGESLFLGSGVSQL